jgi:hypothetical protein
MDCSSLFITWSESINEWINLIKIYISKIGRYKLNNFLLQIEYIESIKEVEIKDLIKFIDNIELNFFILNSVTNTFKSNVFGNFKQLENDILNMQKENIIKYNKILKNTSLFNLEKINGFNHGLIIMTVHLNQLKKSDNTAYVQKYKYNILSKSDKILFKINEDMPMVQRINYLIKPFIECKKKENCININSIIEFNVMQLVDKKSAIKFGPISTISNGLNSQIIERFKTIKSVEIDKDDTNNYKDEYIKDSACLYTGYMYKYITPVNYTKGLNWKPAAGINPSIYKINKQMEDKILSKMIINNKKYLLFDSTKYKSISSDIMLSEIKLNKSKIEEIVTKYCYNSLKNKLDNISDSDLYQIIEKESKLIQYQNILNIINSVKKNILFDINILPIKYIFYLFKLIKQED